MSNTKSSNENVCCQTDRCQCARSERDYLSRLANLATVLAFIFGNLRPCAAMIASAGPAGIAAVGFLSVMIGVVLIAFAEEALLGM